MEATNESENENDASRATWEKFDVETTTKNSQKPDSVATFELGASNQEARDASNDVVKNNGDVTLLNNNGKAPKRRLSSYTSSAIEAASKSGRKRSSIISNGYGKNVVRKKSCIKPLRCYGRQGRVKTLSLGFIVWVAPYSFAGPILSIEAGLFLEDTI